MNIQNLSPFSTLTLRRFAALLPLIICAPAFAQQVHNDLIERLKPVTLPVRAVHRNPNAAVPSCQVSDPTALTSTSEPAEGTLTAPVVYPTAKGPTLLRSPLDLPDKRVRTVSNSKSTRESGSRAVSLATALITGSTPADCTPPTAKVQFATTDQGNIYAFVSIDGGSVGDAVRWDWYAPDGTLAFTYNLTIQFNGASCFWSWIAVSDAKKTGTWTVKVSYQNASLSNLTFTVGAANNGGCSSVSGKICRDEISMFYQGAHSLGTAWVRAVFEGAFPSALAIAQIQGSLDNLVAGLKATPCIPYDLTKIAAVRAAIPTLSSAAIVDRVGALIPDIQLAIRNANLPCDGGANFESLYVVGVDLGASIAEALGFVYSDPLSPGAISFITTAVTNASSAMANYVPCSNNFTPVMLAPANFDLTNSLVLVPLTQLIGTYNLIVWNISLSCCCCTCSAVSTPTTPATGNGTISGIVRNASTGGALSGVTVSIPNTSLTTKTGSDGSYTLTNVPAGARTVQASLPGFVTSSVNVNVTASQTVTQNLSLSPVLTSSGELRITLNWSRSGGVPDDLDMHLISPQSDGSCYEVYFGNQGTTSGPPYAQLEADNIDVSGDPPLETIHIAKLTPGTYTLFIHHYSSVYGEATNAMAASHASVQVFTQAGTVFSQVIPSATGIYWDVLRIDGSTGAITTKNAVSGTLPSSTCH